MDYRLPDLNGLDVISVLRELLPASQFILISGEETFLEGATIQNTNTLAILRKPFSSKQVAGYIQNKFH